MITTWADGYGLWHARVPNTADSEQIAKHAIMSELCQRETNVSASRVSLQRVWSNPHVVEYVEEDN